MLSTFHIQKKVTFFLSPVFKGNKKMPPRSGKGKSNKAKADKKKKEEKGVLLLINITTIVLYIIYWYVYRYCCREFNWYAFLQCLFSFAAAAAPSLVDITVVTPYDAEILLKVYLSIDIDIILYDILQNCL